MCLKRENDTKIEFVFYQKVVASSIPIKLKIKELEFKYRDLVLKIEEEIENSVTRRFDLQNSLYGSSGDILVSSSKKSSLKFNKENSKVELI